MAEFEEFVSHWSMKTYNTRASYIATVQYSVQYAMCMGRNPANISIFQLLPASKFRDRLTQGRHV